MTAKRFEYIMFDGFTDNGEYIMPHQVAEILNEQHEQIQQYKILTEELKRQNKKLKGRLNDLGVEYYD
jgi:hypothetical protein